MASEERPQASEGLPPGWSEPLPLKTPAPTYAPAFLALGMTFALFGIVSSYVFSAAGIALIIWSIGKWIGELLHGE
ncbi:MAG TPA: hypothetical protein VFB33_04760 [Candidatus Binataceae bacterium]|jgi:hypothetical protein|nr:hypothetical protein [Candidatus Binataceae bacterium]